MRCLCQGCHPQFASDELQVHDNDKNIQDELSAIALCDQDVSVHNDIQDELSAIAMCDKKKSAKSTALATNGDDIQIPG